MANFCAFFRQVWRAVTSATRIGDADSAPDTLLDSLDRAVPLLASLASDVDVKVAFFGLWKTLN
jgi:hypothetical protein